MHLRENTPCLGREMFLLSTTLGFINEFMCTVGQFVGHGLRVAARIAVKVHSKASDSLLLIGHLVIGIGLSDGRHRLETVHHNTHQDQGERHKVKHMELKERKKFISSICPNKMSPKSWIFLLLEYNEEPQINFNRYMTGTWWHIDIAFLSTKSSLLTDLPDI